MPPASVFQAASNSRRPYFPAVLSLSQRFYSTRRRRHGEFQHPRIYGKWQDTPSDPNSHDTHLEDENQTMAWFIPESDSESDSVAVYKRSILPKFPVSASKKVRLPRWEKPPPAPRRPPVQYKDSMIRAPGPRRPIAPLDVDIKFFKAPLDGKEIRRAAARAKNLYRDTVIAEQWLDFSGHYQVFQEKVAKWEELTGTKFDVTCPVYPPRLVPYRDHKTSSDRWKVVEAEARRYKLKLY